MSGIYQDLRVRQGRAAVAMLLLLILCAAAFSSCDPRSNHCVISEAEPTPNGWITYQCEDGTEYTFKNQYYLTGDTIR